MNKIKKENLLYRKAIPCSRLFLRKEKTREQAKEVLMLSDSYKSEEDIERELDFIYSAPLEILEDEYKRKIHLFHKLSSLHMLIIRIDTRILRLSWNSI